MTAMKDGLAGVADRVNRRTRRRAIWAGIFGSLAALAGLPVAVWSYAWLFGEAGPPPDTLFGGCVVVMTLVGGAACACHHGATYGSVRLFDDELRRAASQ